MATISEIKELPVTETPLLLFDCELPNGLIERWSTHAAVVEGNTYAARVCSHNLLEMRFGSDEGVDSINRVSVTLANADSYFSQIHRNIGFKGARLTAWFVFYDLSEGQPASERMLLFQGLLNAPEEINETSVRLTAHSRLSLQRYFLPEVRIQRRCPWSFPATPAERAEAVNGAERGLYSPFHRCGYSPDQPGGLGNLGPGGPFTSCDYTRSSCTERGMFDQDSAGRTTRRFGGIEFVPASILVRSHGEKSQHLSSPVENEARYNDYVPLHYGTVWTQPPIVFARSDGNLTRLEVLLGMGEIENVRTVVVNGIEIPAAVAGASMTATGWYHLVSRGGVTGAFNPDFTGPDNQPQGDPYGGMALLAIAVPNRVSDGKSLPQVKVLLDGLRLPLYSAEGGYLGKEFTNNPAWVLLDMLRRSGWRDNEIDFRSFASAAAHCGEQVQVTDLYGNLRNTARYECNLSVQRRRSVADLIRGVRTGSRLYLTYEPSGLLGLRLEASLALQQPAPPVGTNSVEPLNGGWPAYEFGDGSNGSSGIARRPGGESSLRLWSRATAETPNRTSLEFQDAFNEYQQDSLSLVDVNDAAAVKQEISTTSTALGVPNYNQAARVLRLQLNKSIHGNLFAEFTSSVRAISLRPGDIITLTSARDGLLRQPFRVLRLAPSLLDGTIRIEAQIHQDSWYTGEFGLDGGSRVSRRQPDASILVPRPLVGALIDSFGMQQYAISELQDDEEASVMVVEVGYAVPRAPNPSAVATPLVSLSPTVEAGTGTLAGGQVLYYGICAVDQEGGESELSFLVRADLPETGASYSVQLNGISLAPGAAGFNVYRGSSPQQLLRIATQIPPANQYRDTGAVALLAGPPDANFEFAEFEWRLELHPEADVHVSSATTIGNVDLNLTPDEFAGMVVRITRGRGAGQERIVAGHTRTTLSLQRPWAVIPDTSSRFTIAESTWRYGGRSATSPVRLSVPRRPGATIQIAGKAVNALGRDSGYELSPITRHRLEGTATGGGVDEDVPPMPVFGLQAVGRGALELVSVGFTELVNIRTVFAGTLKLFYWDELESPSPLSLLAALSDSATVLSLAGGEVEEGSLIQINGEIIEIDQAQGGGAYTVLRGSHGSAVANHSAGDPVYALSSRIYIVPFVPDFFNSPASGSFAFPIQLPNVRIAAADFHVTNRKGNSETRRARFTATTDRGLRTLSGGQITLQVEGHLAIQDDAMPPLVIESDRAIRDIFAIVNQAPLGAPVELHLRLDDRPLCDLTIAAGTTVSNVVDGFGLPPLRALERLRLDISSVGAPDQSSPGRDLTVVIRL